MVIIIVSEVSLPPNPFFVVLIACFFSLYTSIFLVFAVVSLWSIFSKIWSRAWTTCCRPQQHAHCGVRIFKQYNHHHHICVSPWTNNHCIKNYYQMNSIVNFLLSRSKFHLCYINKYVFYNIYCICYKKYLMGDIPLKRRKSSQNLT